MSLRILVARRFMSLIIARCAGVSLTMSTPPSAMTLKIAMPGIPASSRTTTMRPPEMRGVKIDVTVRSNASEENSGQTRRSPRLYWSFAHQM